MYVYSEHKKGANDPCELLPVKEYDEQQKQVICGIIWFSLNSNDSRGVEWVLLKYLSFIPGQELKLEQPLHNHNNLQKQNRHW